MLTSFSILLPLFLGEYIHFLHIDTSLPVFDTSLPVFDTSLPVFDTSLPVFDTSLPVFDTSLLVPECAIVKWRKNRFLWY